MKKRMLVLCSVALLIVCAVVAGVLLDDKDADSPQSEAAAASVNSDGIHVKRSDAFSSWEEITKDSPFIIVAEVGHRIDTAVVEGAEELKFPITELRVTDPIKGGMSIGDSIRLIQTADIAEDPLVSEGERVLLFLERFSGPQTDDPDAYVCNGLFDGHYIIKNNQVTESYAAPDSLGRVKMQDGKLWGVDPRLDAVISHLSGFCD